MGIKEGESRGHLGMLSPSWPVPSQEIMGAEEGFKFKAQDTLWNCSQRGWRHCNVAIYASWLLFSEPWVKKFIMDDVISEILSILENCDSFPLLTRPPRVTNLSKTLLEILLACSSGKSVGTQFKNPGLNPQRLLFYAVFFLLNHWTFEANEHWLSISWDGCRKLSCNMEMYDIVLAYNIL